jgi:uncharacterized protein YjiK
MISGNQSFNYNDKLYRISINNQIYDLQNPKKRWDLPKELEEISGLSFYQQDQLACIQDEDGVLFIFSLTKNQIIKTAKFSGKGDYEGVETIGDDVYVLKSNGKVYHFSLNKSGIGDIQEIETNLSSKNDTEGLGFESRLSELLIACKEEPGTKKYDLEKCRSVFKIDLPERDFKNKPRFIIDGKAYNDMLEEKDLSKKKHKPFKPSGVAVHPQSGFIFVIGTVGKMLVVLNPEGTLVNLVPLDPDLFWQPEGICFSPDGDLFISSEGRGKKGYILKF